MLEVAGELPPLLKPLLGLIKTALRESALDPAEEAQLAWSQTVPAAATLYERSRALGTPFSKIEPEFPGHLLPSPLKYYLGLWIQHPCSGKGAGQAPLLL